MGRSGRASSSVRRDGGEAGPLGGPATGVPTATWLGLVLALVVVPTYAVVVRPLLRSAGVGERVEVLLGFGVMWVAACAVLVVVRRGEQASWASVGIRRTAPRWILVAVGAGVGLSLLVPVLTVLVGLVLPAVPRGSVDTVAGSLPWTLIVVGVVTAAVTEEVLFRSYPIERLLATCGSRWVAVLVPLVPFSVMHAQGWGIAHVIGVVVPLGLALSALYLWRRNLLVVVVAHLLVDAPLVVLALAQD